MLRTVSAIALAILGVVATSCGRTEVGERKPSAAKAPVSHSVDIGLPAPAYASLSLEGDSVSLAQLRDHPVLVNVWATWCIPCRTEVPVVERIYQRYSPKGLVVIGVNVDAARNLQSVRGFMTAHGISYSVWLDPEKQVLRDFIAIGVPATFLIGRDGTLLLKRMGPLRDDDWGMHRTIQNSLSR
jgi:cytochrome c biogenesis protein CcmG/thiol:disulfide interchange protein DsbE